MCIMVVFWCITWLTIILCCIMTLLYRASRRAAEVKIGMSLPGPFHHVMYSLEGCYSATDCGWAAYGGVNSWFTYYQGNNYKFPAVGLHEIG